MQQKFDPRNENIQVWVGDQLFARQEAKVSVFDSLVQGGDGVWEGLRVYDGKIFSLDKHLNRMQESAKTLGFQNVPSNDEIKSAIFKTLEANQMRTDTHIRLTLSRGEKITSGMDPRLNQKGCTLIVLAEWKPPVYDNDHGITMVTANIRRNSPQFLDSKIHHNNLLNNILAKLEANLAGVNEAVMLDHQGFVAEANATNLFMIKNGEVYTPHAHACLPGITRGLILDICKAEGIPYSERNISISEFYNADEVFNTGTMGELTPVTEIDGRKIENKFGSSVFEKIRNAFREKTKTAGEPLPF